MEGKWAFQLTYSIAQEQFYHSSKYQRDVNAFRLSFSSTKMYTTMF